MKLSSGHLAQLHGREECIALFDNIGFEPTSIKKDSPIGKTVNTLYLHGFVPLTAEARLQLPTF